MIYYIAIWGKKTSPLFLYRLWIEQIERSEVGMKLSEL